MIDAQTQAQKYTSSQKNFLENFGKKTETKSVRLLGIRTANLEEQGALEQMSIMDIMAQTTNKQQNVTTNISREKMEKIGQGTRCHQKQIR